MSASRTISRASSLSYFAAVVKALFDHNVPSTILPLISLVLLCFGCYRNSIANDFTFDDLSAIVNNPDVKFNSEGTDYFFANAKLWTNDIWGKDMRALDSHRSYRPLLVIIFKLIAQRSGGLDPGSFRTISILFHCVSTISVYALSSMVFKNCRLAFGAALLFASHPVHVESVAAVVNMAEATSLTPSIIAFCIFFKSSTVTTSVDNRKYNLWANTGMRLVGQMFRFVFFFVFLIVSVLCKETGITVCGLVVASCGISLLIAIKASLLSRRYQLNKFQLRQSISIREVIKDVFETTLVWGTTNIIWLLAALIGIFFYSIFRVNLLLPTNSEYYFPFRTFTSVFDADPWIGITSRVSKSYLSESKFIRKAENSFAFLVGREKSLSYMYLHFRYFYQLVLPHSLCAEYSFDCIPKVTSLQDPRFFLSLGFYIILISVFIGLLWRSLIPSTMNSQRHANDVTYTSDSKLKIEKSITQDENIKYRNEDEIVYKNAESGFRGSRPWTVEPEHYLLSLVWMIVPFIPASGIASNHFLLIASSSTVAVINPTLRPLDEICPN
jgi:Domain of unknown function (DUF1736)